MQNVKDVKNEYLRILEVWAKIVILRENFALKLYANKNWQFLSLADHLFDCWPVYPLVLFLNSPYSSYWP